MFAQQYGNRRVFVTGHTGFKGSWLTTWLLELGATVAGYSLNIPTEPSMFTELGLEKHITHIQGDVRDRNALSRAISSFRPDIIFHLAAQPLVRLSYEDPAGTFDTNVMGTLNLLEAARNTPDIKAVVCITSDKCYRNDEWVWGYRETDHLGGEDPYSASKGCAEIVAHSYFRSFFKDGPATATVRAGNVIGGGDWALDRIVPDCARAWAKGESVVLRSPWATRPWQHVLEPLSGYLWLGACLMRLKEGGAEEGALPLDKEAFNFGPEAAVNATVAQVTASLGTYWPDFTVTTDEAASSGKKESTLLKLCCDKALAHLHWKPVLSFEDTIRFTAEWYLAFYSGKALAEEKKALAQESQSPESTKEDASDMFALTLRQIAAYTSQAMKKDLLWVS